MSKSGSDAFEDTAVPASQPAPSVSVTAQRIGRYTILDRLGAGSMGSVYSAWDSDLERRVAIKMLHPDGDHVRFVREAQLLAKLKHPNVIDVYDVGHAGNDVFIAMELVEGVTLRAWLDENRPWRDILRVYRAAGEGLAAVHAAGLVHRDVKPDNVLVGTDGIPRVVDFGLARMLVDKSSDSGVRVPSPAVSDPNLTKTGAVMGTPRYMAPEQSKGTLTDERADQFSYAVALWESLYAEHPITKDKRPDKVVGKPPLRIRRALERAIATRPRDRWPTMRALLDELGRDPAAYWRAAAIGVGALVIIVLAVIVAWPKPKPASVCIDDDKPLVGIWDATVREQVKAAFLATKRPTAPAAFDHTTRILDDYAKAWRAMRVDACEATAVRKVQSEALLDLRMQCLDRRSRELGAFAQLLTKTTATGLDDAIVAANKLTELAPCADVETLSTAIPLPKDPATRARIGELRAVLDRATALSTVGKFDEWEKLVRPVLDEAQRIGYAPLVFEAQWHLSRSLQNNKDTKVLEAATDAALVAAAKAKDDRSVARVLVELTNIVGYQGGRPDEALGIARAADVIVEQLDDDDLRQRLLAAKGKVLVQAGRIDQALPVLERAVALRGVDDLQMAPGLGSLGNAYRKAGKLDQAQAAHDRVRAIYTKAFGADHPYVAGTLINLGTIEFDRKRYAESETLLRQALAIQEVHLGAEHVDISRTLTNLGTSLIELARYDEARVALDRSLAIKTKLLPPGHALIGSSLLALGQLDHRQKLDDAALAKFETVRAMREKAGADSLPYAEVLSAIGNLYVDQKKCDLAKPPLARALEILEKQGATLSIAETKESLAKCP